MADLKKTTRPKRKLTEAHKLALAELDIALKRVSKFLGTLGSKKRKHLAITVGELRRLAGGLCDGCHLFRLQDVSDGAMLLVLNNAGFLEPGVLANRRNEVLFRRAGGRHLGSPLWSALEMRVGIAGGNELNDNHRSAARPFKGSAVVTHAKRSRE